MKLCLTFWFIITLCCVESAKILAVYPFPLYSHYNLGNVIFKELAKRGHEVTVISSFKEKHIKNYKQILVDNLIEKGAELKSSISTKIKINIFQKVDWTNSLGTNFTDWALSAPNVKNFLQEDHHFDLVIFHLFMSDAYNGFCYHFNAPCVAISSTTSLSFVNKHIANPAPLSYVPQFLVNSPAKMNFFQRLYNIFVYIVLEYSHYFYLRPNQKRILQKHFPNAPPLDDLFYNLSLILINTHVSVDDVAPYMPNLIPIAGAHIEGPNPLSVDLKKYLDDAKEGVIYFSMGSALKSVDIPKEKREAFLKVFSRLEQKVFWKWDDETLPHKSSNVFISPWFPQQDILAHPNVKLFITHGGLMSVIESVHFAVPILGIPLFADQGLNIARAEVAGYAKRIFYDDLNEDVLEITINEMLKNPRYKENAQKQTFILKDQVIPPLDNAIFWIEYVIRHKGAPHLKSAALNLSWYQYHLLDVTGFVFLILLFTLIGLKITFSLSWKSWFGKKNVEVTKKDQ